MFANFGVESISQRFELMLLFEEVNQVIQFILVASRQLLQGPKVDALAPRRRVDIVDRPYLVVLVSTVGM